MTEIQRIVDQLKRAFEGTAWHGPSVKEVLAGVNASTAAARPLTGSHSIWELVHHVAAWEEIVRRRIEGELLVDISDEQDWPPVTDTSEAAWSEALAALERGHMQLRDVISRMDDSRLEEPVPGKGHSFYILLHGVVQHDLYHAGQISLLKKA